MDEKYKGQTKRIWYQKGHQDAINELKIGDLRQWLNEKPCAQIVHDKDIEIMLGITNDDK